MIQLWALTVDSGPLPGDPLLGEGGGVRHTRWDVITPCNLQEIQGAACSADESVSFCSPSSATHKKRLREAIPLAWCPPGVSPGTISNQLPPWSHVLSLRSGRTDRQSDCPFEGPGTASQHTNLPRFILVRKEPSGAYRAPCTVYLTVY